MIADSSIQLVKDAARVEEVVGDFVHLKRKGPRFLGLCPFHNEKTPSFNVSPQLGIFKCFGCGESGDAIGFLQKHEHLSFVESIRWLAKRYGIELQEEERNEEQQAAQSERESLAVVQEWALKWSIGQLWESEEGQRIGLAYFRERGFLETTIREFQLGYVPERGDAFAKAALAHGFTAEQLEKAGWVKLREDGTAWDFFQGRVTFPIHGLGGQPIAFGARTLRSDKKLAKYFNSPESALYVKGRSLYGIALAKKAIVEAKQCLLVEGYTDVISLHQAGVLNVVASSGTSLTVEQVRLIKRFAPLVVMLYDGDAAGMKASLRGIDLILAEGLHVKVVALPEGEDPDSFARGHSSSEITTYLEQQAKDFLVFKADLLVAEAGDDPVARAQAIHELVQSIALVPDHVLRSLYVKRCASLLQIAEQALVAELNKELRKQYRKKVGPDNAPAPEMLAPEVAPPQAIAEDLGTKPQEEELLRLLIAYGEQSITVPIQESDGTTQDEEMSVAELMFISLATDDIVFEEPLFQAIYRDYRFARNMGEPVGRSRYLENEKEEWRKLTIDLLTQRHLLSPGWSGHKIHVPLESDDLCKTVQHELNAFKGRRVDRMLKQAQEELKELEASADRENTDELLPDRVLANLQRQQALLAAKKDLAQATGRVIVA